MTNVRLRYTGELSVIFQHPGVGYVEQNGEFDVPEDEAEAFTRRADIELVSGTPKTPRTPKTPKTGDANGAGDPDPDA